jgi:hypothetical protein
MVRINAQEGREQRQVAGKSAIPPMKDDFTLGAESQHQRRSSPTPW